MKKRRGTHKVNRTAISGFTLLELLIVLVILGMVAALVIPNISSNQGIVLKAQAREVIAILKHARRSAIVEGKQKEVVLSEGSKEVVNQSSSKKGSGHWVSRGVTLQLREIISNPSEISEQAVNDQDEVNEPNGKNQTTYKITFYPEGGSSGGELTLNYLDYKAKININPLTGKIDSDIFDNEE